MTNSNNNPWLAAAIEMHELLKVESPEVQQAQWKLSKKKYPEVYFPIDDNFDDYLNVLTEVSDLLLDPKEQPFLHSQENP